jgi:hypothetical protein
MRVGVGEQKCNGSDLIVPNTHLHIDRLLSTVAAKKAAQGAAGRNNNSGQGRAGSWERQGGSRVLGHETSAAAVAAAAEKGG